MSLLACIYSNCLIFEEKRSFSAPIFGECYKSNKEKIIFCIFLGPPRHDVFLFTVIAMNGAQWMKSFPKTSGRIILCLFLHNFQHS